MNNHVTKKKFRVYMIVMYILFLITYLFLVHRDYAWTVCQENLESSSNLVNIWHQLTPMPKFLTIVIIYVTLHALVAIVKNLLSSRK
jgi:hypothetical protein